MTKVAGIRVLKWLGGDHANYNMGLFAQGAVSNLTGPISRRSSIEVARQTGTAAAPLKSQPFSWDSVPNFFAMLPHPDGAKQRLLRKARRFHCALRGPIQQAVARYARA